MATVELCYTTAKGAGVCRSLRDAEATEKALKALARRHIEADLYVYGERDVQGNRTARVGGVDHIDGDNGGRTFQWQWWFDPAVFESTHADIKEVHW